MNETKEKDNQFRFQYTIPEYLLNYKMNSKRNSLFDINPFADCSHFIKSKHMIKPSYSLSKNEK